MALNLRPENIFASGYILEFPEGDRMLLRREAAYTPSVNKDLVHTVRGGDTITAIAHRYYNSDLWWHVIADVNQIHNPFELILGQELIIPDLDIIKASRK